MERVYLSHSPGLNLVKLGVVFVATGADEVDVLRRRGRRRVRAYSGERNRTVGRGTFRTSDPAVQRDLEASESFGREFWREA